MAEPDRQRPELNAEGLKELLRQNGRVKFSSLLKEFLRQKRLQTYLSPRTVQTYESQARCLLRRLHYDPDITEVDELFAQRLVEAHSGTVCRNYLLKLVQLMKQVSELAHMQGHTRRNMLAYFSFRFDRKKIVFLTEDEVTVLLKHQFASPSLSIIRDLFIFQCCTGLSYADLQSFHPKMIKDIRKRAYVTGERGKTGVNFTAPMPKAANELLRKWKENPPTVCNQHYNRLLKEIALICGIDKNLTTYVARKTAGMTWLNMGYSIEAISRMLGHTNIKTTQQWYAHILPDRVVRETKEIYSRQNKPGAYVAA